MAAAEALRDHPLHAAVMRGREQMVGSNGAQPVAAGEGAVELAQVRRAFQIRELMHDHIRACSDDSGVNGFLIERVGNDRLCAEVPQEPSLRWRSRQSDDAMTFADQERNQTASDGARRACNENAHGITSCLDNLPQSRLVLLPMDSRVRKRLSAEARRAGIIEAAVSAFARDGYDATKMDSIAAGAGITKPVLYDHFPSKQALFLAVLESIRDSLLARGKTIVGEDADPEQKFRRSVDAFLEFVEQAPDAARVLLTVPASDPVAAKVSREVQAGASASIAALLAAFMPGRMPWHRQATAVFLKEGLHAVAVWWLDHPGPSREEIAGIVLDATWLGLRGQAR